MRHEVVERVRQRRARDRPSIDLRELDGHLGPAGLAHLSFVGHHAPPLYLQQGRRELLLAEVLLQRLEVHQYHVLLREVLGTDARAFSASRVGWALVDQHLE